MEETINDLWYFKHPAMKFRLLIPLLLFCFSSIGQTNGYYVNLSNDTIPAYIHLKKDVFGPYSFTNLYQEVRISKDISSEQKVFKPGEIHSFYVKSEMYEYSFYTKTLDEYEIKFM